MKVKYDGKYYLVRSRMKKKSFIDVLDKLDKQCGRMMRRNRPYYSNSNHFVRFQVCSELGVLRRLAATLTKSRLKVLDPKEARSAISCNGLEFF